VTLLHVFWAFFITNILGYGGGPSTIPLYQAEVVTHYHWMTNSEFGDVLAIANALPGPISTKLGGFVGFKAAGILGAIVAEIATVLPSAVAVVLLVKFAEKFKDAPQVKALSRSVQPVIAVMLGVLAVQFFTGSTDSVGWFQGILLTVLAFLTLQVWKVHPALVILGSLVYGAIVL
jgi:chromate transporter